ncbi:hypothetical protein ACFS07_01360 [Undibacterium arcticum]
MTPFLAQCLPRFAELVKGHAPYDGREQQASNGPGQDDVKTAAQESEFGCLAAKAPAHMSDDRHAAFHSYKVINMRKARMFFFNETFQREVLQKEVLGGKIITPSTFLSG